MRVRFSFSSRKTGAARATHTNKHKKQVPKIVTEVIKISDIVLEILDARFIDKTRNPEIEDLIKKKGKDIIFVLNKTDLVNKDALILELKEKNIYPYSIVSCTKRFGSRDLRDRIKIEVKKLKIFNEHKKAHVGVIGYPNTGKSSLINFLTGRGVAATSSVAGFTKGIKKIKLTKDILLLDTPGIIPPSEDASVQINTDMQTKHATINVKTFDKVKNPDLIVQNLLDEYPNIIESHYSIEANGDAEVLLEKLGRKLNFLKKGNEVDEDRTARLILKDWQQGKIKIK